MFNFFKTVSFSSFEKLDKYSNLISLSSISFTILVKISILFFLYLLSSFKSNFCTINNSLSNRIFKFIPLA